MSAITFEALPPPNPDQNRVVARVNVNVFGTAPIDARPGEASKLVALSSMNIAPNVWDARHAFADGRRYPMPDSDWIIPPPTNARLLGFAGGTSDWKTNSPTVTIVMNAAQPIAGWTTAESDPNDDNLSSWFASDSIVRTCSNSVLVDRFVS